MFSLLCILLCGCAAAENHTLSENQLASLKHTKTVSLAVTGVDGQRKAYFADIFKKQLEVNGVTVVPAQAKNPRDADSDAVISLACYYVDFGQINLNRSTDFQFGHGPKTATGVGKRIGCRLIVSHKNLGTLFDGEIQGATRLSGQIDAADFQKAIATPEGFSDFLERNAQTHFEADLKRSKGWLYVMNMKPTE